MTLTRAAALGLAALAGFAAVVITIPGQASAATAYRYWAFYLGHAGSGWQYSERGPAYEYPVDGDVEGWRFAIQADAANGLLPRAKPDFATLCASSPPKAGELRVGVVIDFGLATDAPANERPPAGVVPGCVYVQDDETDMNVLAAAATIRIGTGSYVGLVCGIDGYPKTECPVAAAAHSSAPPAPTPAPTHAHTQQPATAATEQPPPTARSSGSTPSVSSAATVPPSAGVQSTVASVQPLASAQSSAHAGSSATATAEAAPATSLSALRSSGRHNGRVPAATIAGIALIVILGAGAVWRARARGR
jgi:hypothetical protein